jgi:hypothetical protein
MEQLFEYLGDEVYEACYAVVMDCKQAA